MAPLGDLVSRLPGGVDIDGIDLAFLGAVADDLVANPGASLVVPGAGQSPRVHALTHAINYALRNVDKTFAVGPVLGEGDEPSRTSITALAADIDGV